MADSQRSRYQEWTDMHQNLEITRIDRVSQLEQKPAHPNFHYTTSKQTSKPSNQARAFRKAKRQSIIHRIHSIAFQRRRSKGVSKGVIQGILYIAAANFGGLADSKIRLYLCRHVYTVRIMIRDCTLYIPSHPLTSMSSPYIASL